MNSLSVKKAPYLRRTVSEQLFTGHMRVDMCQPLTIGNFVVFKGHKQSSGKGLAIQGAIKSFLERKPEGRVIHVSLQAQTAEAIIQNVSADLRERIALITAVDDNRANEGSQFLTPLIGLNFAQRHLDNGTPLLFVFEDVLLHNIREKQVFLKAKQQQAPINVINELYE